MQSHREFFPRVKKSVVPRPPRQAEVDILGVAGTARCAAATIYGSNWRHQPFDDLVEVWDAGAALCFRQILPSKDKYAREGLYLQLTLAYRTTENANVNIRTFSGNHVTLPNAIHGGLYQDPETVHWVTDDLTLNVNSIYQGERVWFQRVDWEWVSRETVYPDELAVAGLYLHRSREEVEAIYRRPELTDETVREYLAERLQRDQAFARRCMAMLYADSLGGRGSVELLRQLEPDLSDDAAEQAAETERGSGVAIAG